MTDTEKKPEPETFEALSKDEKIRHVILMCRAALESIDSDRTTMNVTLSAIEQKLSEIIIH